MEVLIGCVSVMVTGEEGVQNQTSHVHPSIKPAPFLPSSPHHEMKCLLTGNSGDELEGAQHSEGPQRVQVERLLRSGRHQERKKSAKGK